MNFTHIDYTPANNQYLDIIISTHPGAIVGAGELYALDVTAGLRGEAAVRKEVCIAELLVEKSMCL